MESYAPAVAEKIHHAMAPRLGGLPPTVSPGDPGLAGDVEQDAQGAAEGVIQVNTAARTRASCAVMAGRTERRPVRRRRRLRRRPCPAVPPRHRLRRHAAARHAR